MHLVIKTGGAAAMPEWRALFAHAAPGLRVSGWDDADADQADYALVWEPDPGRLAAMPNLRLIISSAAGVDHILADPLRPVHLPIVRMVPEQTSQTMAEFVLAAAMMVLRDFTAIAHAQANRRWLPYPPVRGIAQTRVGIMGMGNMGRAAAALLARVGFDVAGWSNRHTDLAGVASFAGPAQFDAFLHRTDVLVCLLPATDATRGILNHRTLAQLPAGASLIHVGRGAHMVEADVLQMLDSGHLHRAVIDVFDVEPLPPDAPWWCHPAVTVTPHCAATATRADRARHTAHLIACDQQGIALPDRYDPQRGY